MALIKTFEEKRRDRQSIHDSIDATYAVFERDGRTFVQIDTRGRAERENPRRFRKACNSTEGLPASCSTSCGMLSAFADFCLSCRGYGDRVYGQITD
jgi:hypothetical protein